MASEWLTSAGHIHEYLISHFSAQILTDHELEKYPSRNFLRGWEFPTNILTEHLALDFRLRVLIPEHFPFRAPRIALYPAPSMLQYPHLERGGLLCLLSDESLYPVDDAVGLTKHLIDEAEALISSWADPDIERAFQDEFLNYWILADNVKYRARSLIEPGAIQASSVIWASEIDGVLTVASSIDALNLWSKGFCGKKVEKSDSEPACFVRLSQPIVPDQYPENGKDVISLLKAEGKPYEVFQEVLLKRYGKNLFILFCAPVHSGVVFWGIRLLPPSSGYQGHYHGDPLKKGGFRGKPPLPILVTRYYQGAITGYVIDRFDTSWVHGRDRNPHVEELQSKHVVLLGNGALGSGVAKLLAQMGVGRMTLIDPSDFAPENLARHELSAPNVGKSKATCLAQKLSRQFPHLHVMGFESEWQSVYAKQPDLFRNSDLIISAIGQWSEESHLDSLWRSDVPMQTIIYGWLEPRGVAGHALVLQSGQGCLRCIVKNNGIVSSPVVIWNEEPTPLDAPGCGLSFDPFTAIDLHIVQSLVAKSAMDVLLGRLPRSAHRAWVASRDFVRELGGDWNPKWDDKSHPLGDGNMMQSRTDIPNPHCECCSSNEHAGF